MWATTSCTFAAPGKGDAKACARLGARYESGSSQRVAATPAVASAAASAASSDADAAPSETTPLVQYREMAAAMVSQLRFARFKTTSPSVT